jgi:hypothetical protein
MAGKVVWNDQWAKGFRGEMKRRTSAAAIRLTSRVKAEISQSGTLRYSQAGKGGKSKSRTVYNFTHSAPGNPPFKQKGTLRQRIMWELVALALGTTFIGRVGTNYKVGRYLELGTRRMRARPFLRMALKKYGPELAAILLKKFPAGGLPGITSSQFRSGILGSGARRAGF